MNKVKGVVFSILLGLFATLPWIVLNYFGWIVSLAGYLIGLAAYKGYTKFNPNFDRVGKFTVAIVILLAIPFAEMVNIFIAGIEYSHSIVISLIGTPLLFLSYLSDFLPNILLGYLMAVLGTYQFFYNPVKTRRNKIIKKETRETENIEELIEKQISLVIDSLVRNGADVNSIHTAEFTYSGSTEELRKLEYAVTGSEFLKSNETSSQNFLVLTIRSPLDKKVIAKYAYKLYKIAENFEVNYEGFQSLIVK